MRIRPHGQPHELRAAVAALGQVLNLHTISQPHPDRAPSTHTRIYIEATTRENGERR